MCEDSVNVLLRKAEAACEKVFAAIDAREEYHTSRVLEAFHREHIAARHFAPTTGYGYDDIGRDAFERILAYTFGTEEAIVRPHIVSGTAALYLALSGLLLPGDELLSATGLPYDTMQTVIGINQKTPNCLTEHGVIYRQAELSDNGAPDIAAILDLITPKTKIISFQRSRGYAWRDAVTIETLKTVFAAIRRRHPDVILLVDNCYGAFVEDMEPTMVGADIIVGSLIKNAGGGLAPTGGYIAGRRPLIERIAARMTAPGIGREEGSYAGDYRLFYQGFFMAPHAVAQSLKTAVLAAKVFEELGMKTSPAYDAVRSDIIQAVELKTPERLNAFCAAVQASSPVDADAVPEAWDMPGYEDKVIMAAGTFVSGASIELSADAPLREPFIVYMQGGLTYAHGKTALRHVLETLVSRKLIG